ncbi:hypothetical protein [Vibrio sp. WXL103]|uniref:hypothetical protein n=1 Tax=Vibrio sp. WXL103 TaxID=3450710 RepID=UPI003EC70911
MLVFIAFTMDQGIGGHYYSLKAISEQYDDYKVIIIGHTKPKVNYKNFEYISIKKHGYLGAIRRLQCRVEKSDLMHCFDEHSFAFARVVSMLNKVPIVLTKCGGKPLRYYPSCNAISVFSKEDQRYFLRQNISTNLIPNRIDIVNLTEVIAKSSNDVRPFKVSSSKQGRTAICIARIGSKYQKKIISSIKLSAKLKEKGCLLNVSVVGVLEDRNVLIELEELCISLKVQDRVSFYTSNEITTDAVKWLPFFDFCIGTGRGAMEAICLNVRTLSPVSNLDIPILIDGDSFDSLFSHNFSERSVSPITESDALEIICNNFNSLDRNDARDLYENLSRNYFDLSSVREKYIDLYDKAKLQSFMGIFDIVLNFAYLKYIERQKLK